MAFGLPDEVLQGLGMMPPQGLPAPPAAPDPMGGLHPVVQQALGLAPPPSLPPPPLEASSPPVSLPSAQHQAPPPEAPSRDYQIQTPAPAPVAAPRQPQPQRAPTPDQQVNAANAEQRAADQSSQSANASETAVKVAQADAQVANYNAANAEHERLQGEMKAEQDDFRKTHAQKSAILDGFNKDVDSYKIDQNKYWNDLGIGSHVGLYVGMALSGLGNAFLGMNNPGQGAAENPVIKMIQDKTKQSIAAQMDQRDQLEKRAGRAEHTLDRYDAFSKDRQSQILAREADADRNLARMVMTTSAKFADPMARANGQQIEAQLNQSAAEKQAKAAERATQVDMQRKQLAIAQSANAIAGGHLAIANRAENRAQKLQDLEYGPGGFKEQELGLKAADEMRKMMAAKKQATAELGVFNPTTGDPLLTAEGRKMMANADRLEAAARQNPAQAAQAYVDRLRSEAATPQGKQQVADLEAKIKSDPATAKQVADGYVAQIRDNAKSNEVATIADKEDRRKVVDTIKHSQDLVNTVAKMQEYIRSDPSFTDRDGWAALQTQYGDVVKDYIKGFGANASSREFEAITHHVLTFDPNSMIDRATGKGKLEASLRELATAVKSGTDTELRSRGVKDGWIPTSPLDNPSETFGGKTAGEVGADETPGWVETYAAGKDIDPGDAVRNATETALGRTNAAGQSSNYGLDPTDDNKAQALLSKAAAVGNAERSRIVEQLAAPILQQNRPSLAAGLLRLVHDRDPSMYEEILAKLPADQAKDIRAFDAIKAQLPGSAANSQPGAQGLPPVRM